MSETPETETVNCIKCGIEFERPTKTSGRPAVRCPEHRQGRGKLTDTEGYRERRNSMRQIRRAGKGLGMTSRQSTKLMFLPVWLLGLIIGWFIGAFWAGLREGFVAMQNE